MKNLKISVIIPAYNAVDFIEVALKSIENQTYQNYEIIIINDGSTDKTKEFLDNYQIDKMNVIVYHQENKGVSVARNKGIELASGDFVCFLDSDDTYDETFFEKMLNKRDETNGQIIYCGFKRIKNNRVRYEYIPKNDGNIIKAFLMNEYFPFCGMIIDRLLLKEKGIYFRENMTIGEDILFMLNLMIEKDFFHVGEPLFNYHYRKSSVMNSVKNDTFLKKEISAWEIISHYLILNYNKSDKKAIVYWANVALHRRKLEFLLQNLRQYNFKKVKNYLLDNDVSFFSRCFPFNRKDRKLFKIISRGNYFRMFMHATYYKYLRW